MKKEVRIVAWDDCAFGFDDKTVRLVAPMFSGGIMHGMLSALIKKNGTDVTDRICSSVLEFDEKISVVMLDGIVFGGLNMADIRAIRKNTGARVIAVTAKKPNVKDLLLELKKFDNYKERLRAVSNAGNIYTYSDIFYQKDGMTLGECEELLKQTCINGMPEPLRVAHLIASGLSGESNGRA